MDGSSDPTRFVDETTGKHFRPNLSNELLRA